MKKFSLVLFVFAMFFLVGCEKQADSVSTTSVERSSGTYSDAVTIADDKGVVGKYPGQYELAEFEDLTGENVSFSDNPMFSDMSVKVEQRLPSEPLVMAPEHEIGTYGGTLRTLSRAPESGTAGALSLRHVNLVRMSADFQTIVPDVAKSFEFNDDYTELTFVLREGHKWSDGHPFTTEDILFWWEDIQLNTDLNELVKSKWIFGGEPMKVEAIDDLTVKFSFAVPSPGFIISLAVGYTQLFQPKHVLQEFHIKYNSAADEMAEELGYKTWPLLFYAYYNDWKDSYHPLTAMLPVDIPSLESHVLVSENTEQRVLQANPYYHVVDTLGNQLPYFDEIHEVFIEDTQVRNLKLAQGEIDFKAQDMELLDYPYFQKNMEDGDFVARLVSSGTTQTPAPGFNLTHKDPAIREIFNNIKFREAMSLAINRDEMNEVIYFGTGVPVSGVPGSIERSGFVTEEMTTYMTEYNPQRANELLDEIGLQKDTDGFRLKPDGTPFVVYLTYTTQGSAAKVWQFLKEYWDAVGVRTELKEVNTDLYRSLVNNNDHDLSAWTVQGGEPVSYYSSSGFIPPFGGGAGIGWEKWIESDGKEGFEPPQFVVDLIDLNTEFIQQGFQSERYKEIGSELAEIVVQQLFLIGTVGETKLPVIVSNRTGNVGEMIISSSSYYFNYPFRPCQWYSKY